MSTTEIQAGQTWRSEDGYLYRIVSVEPLEWVYARHPNSKGGLYQIRREWFSEPGWELVRDAA